MTVAERFWAKARKTSRGCWKWTGCTNADGYGRFMLAGGRIGGRVENAHRVAWSLTHGDIPKGLVVRHACDNPSCVNPAHLLLGTHAENAKDKAIRQRARIKTTDDDIRAVRSASGRYRDIGARFGISAAYVCQIKNGKAGRHVG